MSIPTSTRAELPPEAVRVIRYLRSPAGELWTRERIGEDGRLERHHEASGVFADVIVDGAYGWSQAADWPEPHHDWHLGDELV